MTKLDATGATLLYSTFLGGGSSDSGQGIAVEASGQAYVAGYTYSSDFPTTTGAYATSFNASGSSDVFVAKLDVVGTALIYSTFLGGDATDVGNGIAVDAAGQAYVAGATYSTDFPTTPGAYNTTFNLSGAGDVFVTKLDAGGATLSYSTLLGGDGDDTGQDVAVDGSGRAYVTGYTYSPDFPTTAGAHDTTWNNSFDTFLTKLDPVGATLAYSTFLGGGDDDFGSAVAVDGAENAHVTGFTLSNDFPTTPGAYDTSVNGSYDAFVAKISTVNPPAALELSPAAPLGVLCRV